MNHICKKCKGEISSLDLVACPNCEQKYHKWCWSQNSICLNCGQSTDVEPVKVKKEDDELSVYEEGMFANIGEKIKGVAKFTTAVGSIIGIIVFIAMALIDDSMILAGLLVGVIVAIVSWVSSFTLYGFGVLISSTQNTERLTIELLKEMKNKE
ncbi:MAG: hypothetical protein J6B37_09085 [Clostridia bacterium]|nr:hypothetical protein [Clostridia bacterium]